MSELVDAVSLRCEIAERLARWYLKDRPHAAALCDEDIDRSGNLLNWLRVLALEISDE